MEIPPPARQSFLHRSLRVSLLVLSTACVAVAQNHLSTPLRGRFKGEEAITQLGAQLPAVAQAHGLSAEKLKELFRTQRDLHVEPQGSLMFVCEGLPAGAAPSNATATSERVEQLVTSSSGDPLRLHSFPGASRVVYLDFDGHTTSGTLWNSNYANGATIHSQPFDLDGSPSTLNATEQAIIRGIWQRVAEDYAPFAVDVTTEDPGLESLRKTSSGDAAYGIRVVISPSNWYSGSAGGVAYIGAFSWGSDTPCFVFSGQLANSEKYIAEAAAHEAGHTFGLYHDGRSGSSATEYFSGHGSWAPIMGVSYYRPITQFSRGEYANANNTQDDFAIMSGHAPFASDDHGNTTGAATTLAGPNVSDGGTLERSSDVDVFSFVTAAGTVSLAIQGPSPEPNLDIKAELLNANGQVLQASDPTGLSASLVASLPAGTYYVRISGVGAGDPGTTGYSTYGSVGNYVITGTLASATSNQPPVAAASTSATSGTAPLPVNFSSAGSSDPDGSIASYRWTFGDGGTSASANPSYTYNAAGNYTATLTVTDNGGLTASSSVNIAVSSVTSGSAPVILTQPVSQTVPPLSTVTFGVVATGDPAPTYLWRRNGVSFGGWNTSSITLYAVTSNDVGTYVVEVTNSAGSVTSVPVTLTLGETAPNYVAPTITQHPLSQTVSSGATVTLSAGASGQPTPALQWRKDGVAIGGATGSSLTLGNVSTADNATYTLVATNLAGTAVSNGATLTVNPTSGSDAPVITTQPVSQVAPTFSTVTFSVAASGSPAPTYLWRRNGITFAGWNTPSITLHAITSNDVGTYVVEVTNSAGSVTSNPVTLTLGESSSTNIAPSIIQQPVSQSATAGANVTFTVAATGSPAPTYVWRRDGVTFSGWTGSTLTLYGVSSNDAGTYTVDVSNVAGSVSSAPAILTVGQTATYDVAPSITQQPASQTARWGSTVTFSVGATGTPAPSYRWRRNGVTFGGWNEPTVTLYCVTSNDVGTYIVEVSNSAGTVYSVPVTLSVTP